MTEQKKKSSGTATKKKRTSTAKKRITAEERAKIEKKNRLRDEIWSIILIAVGAFLVISLQTHATGQLGEGISALFKGMFGMAAYILPYYLIAYGILLFTKMTAHLGTRSVVCLLLIFFMLNLIISAWYLHGDAGAVKFTFKYVAQAFTMGKVLESGGVFGMCVGLLLVKLIGVFGLCILAGVTMLICILLVINTPVSLFFDTWKEKRAERKAREDEEEALLAEAREAEAAAMAAEGKLSSKKSASAKTTAPPVRGSASEGRGSVSTGPVRPFLSGAAGITPSQLKILDYMKDDELFEGTEDRRSGLGLEEPSVPEPGKGFPVEGTGLQEYSPVVSGVVSGGFSAGTSDGSATPESAVLEPIAAEPILTEPVIPTVEVRMPAMEEPDPIIHTPEPAVERTSEAPHSQTEGQEGARKKKAAAEPVEELTVVIGGVSKTPYQFPPMDLLHKAPVVNNRGEEVELQAKAIKLEETLHDFGVNAKVLQVTKGPAVTRYEIQPSTGVKVNSIVRLADDIALNLEAKSIRMEAPIPGKAAVGIEVENERVNMVTLREIVDSDAFRSAKSKISFAVGKDISGTPIVADLKGMPHLLIAGSTGSGKSVCINSIIISMMYKAKPEEVKFVLIDPKVVELSNYNGIPHMLIPVVTDPSKAAAALNWAVAEMTDRYKKFAEEGVRDLESFNQSVKSKGEDERFMPQVVIIIDELADLMMAAPSQVEESICRLAQMARAAGMHLIVATQRPSVDVITGVIKANIPSRIAFAVSSQVDSRTILDMAGAEKLVGKGDMLFNPLGRAKPLRVQGAFLSDEEVHSVIQFAKENTPQTEYSQDVLHSIEKVQTDVKDDDEDELLPDAIEAVVRAEQASVSMLQRRFRVGYNRAARLVDSLEARGIIGPADGSRPRKVLMTAEELEAMKRGDEEPNDEPVPDLID